MIVRRVLNNSIVAAIDDNLDEVILLGRGIGFKSSPGQHVDPATVDKVFRLDGRAAQDRFALVAQSVPAEVLQATEEIVAAARERLEAPLSDTVFAALADHLAYAVERQAQGVSLANALESEVSRFYPAEHRLGLDALAIVARVIGTALPRDEATNIALHLINAQTAGGGSAHREIELTHQILDVARLHLGLTYDESSLEYQRFSQHVRYFAQRVLRGKTVDKDDDDGLLSVLVEKKPELVACAVRIAAFVKERHGQEMSSSEMVYLTMHLDRVA
ncbi:PRD domain-containing protein [Demequina capsici]|uniref:PRD domain-containing protein n=1 Tax=Demequina capsici TaxID=3075620 RepID=A0AA96JD82_9MICO|nr:MULTISPECIES: PRD domain-containing protein [unclassified Demequina]WNM24404.1 PRD domain-containing protein [Demequina sp. OYTSA14]WNM27238.1 PRD domain-containing protein [Demequina sp. PMTSA13]